MGCDGGTIPTRDEMVRLKKQPEKVDKNFELNAKWNHCALSQEQLRLPIVSCELGNLYNKEKVLEYLLDKSSAISDVAKHIRSLKDTKELNLTENQTFDQKSKERAVGYVDFQASPFVCPVVGLEMNGRYKFCFLWKCGCVFSERAMKEVKSPVCHKCAKPFSDDDVVVLNGNEEEVEAMRSKMDARRLKAKLEKKAKKSKVTETITSSNTGPSTSGNVIGNDDSSSKNAKRSASATGTDVPSKKTKVDSKLAMNGAAGSSKNGKSSKGKDPRINMQMPEFSKYNTVAEDPEASKVYKSLFASGHEKRPEHLKSNWVTYHSYGGYHI